MKHTNITLDDLPRCAALYAEVFSAPPWSEQWTIAQAQQRLKEIIDTPGFVGVLAVDTDLAVGMAMGTIQTRPAGRDYYLQEMCVIPNRLRQGIGTSLIDALYVAISLYGVSTVFLLTQREGAAAAFYARKGFRSSTRMAMMTHSCETGKKCNPLG